MTEMSYVVDRSTQDKVLEAIQEGARVEDVCEMLGCTTYAYYYRIRPANHDFDRRIKQVLDEREEPVPEEEDAPLWGDGSETPDETKRRAEILKVTRKHAIT